MSMHPEVALDLTITDQRAWPLSVFWTKPTIDSPCQEIIMMGARHLLPTKSRIKTELAFKKLSD
jgi:hypothetical protein